MKWVSSSEEDTKKFAADFAKQIIKKKRRVVVALDGELGAGKTTFAQGFARALGIRRKIMSPTFVFVRRSVIKEKGFKNFFHIDAYRVKKGDNLDAIGLREIFSGDGNVALVEWASSVKKILPKSAIWVRMRHGIHQNERVILMKSEARNSKPETDRRSS